MHIYELLNIHRNEQNTYSKHSTNTYTMGPPLSWAHPPRTALLLNHGQIKELTLNDSSMPTWAQPNKELGTQAQYKTQIAISIINEYISVYLMIHLKKCLFNDKCSKNATNGIEHIKKYNQWHRAQVLISNAALQ